MSPGDSRSFWLLVLRTGIFLRIFLIASFLLLASCVAEQGRAPVSQIEVQEQAVSGPVTTYKGRTAVVKKGDNLYSISFEAGFNWHDIAEWNNIEGPDYTIFPNQIIKLYPPNAKPVQVTESEAIRTSPVSSEPSDNQSTASTTGTSSKSSTAATSSTTSTASVSSNAAVPGEVVGTSSGGSSPSKWIWPTKGRVVQNFSAGKNHNGIEIAGQMGEPVRVSASGKVVYSGTGLQGYGRLVIVQHDKNLISAYAHNSKLVVKEGDQVKQGQKIAEMGNTDTDRVKLHFEIRLNGKPVDPRRYLPKS